jgi:SAM-dependent methyltransferase
LTDLSAYYESSAEYRRMLADQDEEVFDRYVGYFRRWLPPGSHVVDVGCGIGVSTRLLREAGFAAVGTDASSMLLPDEEGFSVADFTERTDLRDGSFAAAGALNVLEHVGRPREFLEEMVRVVEQGGLVVLSSPNLTSPLVAIRVLVDLALRRTPYLGLGRWRDALRLLADNVLRSAAAALGRDAFAPREDTLATGIVGHDVDAVYWSNAAEVRRHLDRLGCEVVHYQGEGRTPGSRALARVLPSFAGQLAIVARVGPTSPPAPTRR